MKNLKHIALFLSCLVIASCTKDIDEKEPSNECSILDIQLTGQLGKATIERVDDNQGTVTLYIFEQADYPWEAVGVEALALSAYATADVSDGDTLDFRNPERKARIIVRSQTGKQVLWTVYLKPYDPFYVGTWGQRHQDIPGPEYQRQRYRKVGYFDGRFRVRVVRLAGVG